MQSASSMLIRRLRAVSADRAARRPAVFAPLLVALAVGWVPALAQTPTARAPLSAVARLQDRVPEVAFADAPLELVMDWLQEYSGVNVVVRWELLDEYGIGRDKPVSLRVRDLTLGQALWLIINQVGGPDVKLAYRASDSLLIISTAEDFNRELITRVYDVRDLLVRVPRFNNAPRLDPSQVLSGAASGGGGGSGSVLTQPGEDPEPELPTDEAAAALVQLIRDTIEPDTWVQAGGRGQVVAWQGRIVVTNSLLVHTRLAGPVEE